eukprot:9691619-Alexandrium_andersonii.AAC.1
MLAEPTVLPGDAPRKGARYLAADGGRVSNLGEVELGFVAKEQHRCKIKFVPLCSGEAAIALTSAGNEVFFCSGGG